MIPPRFLEEIRNRLTLSDIIGRRTKVTRAGREFKACCPFHHEKTPSFTINDDKQFYHCFGCGAHGDVLGFVMRHDNLSFIDAVEVLAAEAGLQMPKMDPQEAKKAQKAKDLHALMEQATRWFEQNLYTPGNERVLQYLLERGLTRETLSAFRVGYAPADRQVMRSYLKGEGYSDKDMIDVGLLRPPGKGGEPYAFFRERVMFPVSDKRGRIVAYGGRILPDHMRAPDQGDYTPAKYMNSSDTVLFDKSRTLYGAALARQVVGDDQPAVVTEGYMDVIACHQAGFKGAVAPMGTALTEQQIIALWNMIPGEEKLPILCFDGDNAGRRAASRACERVLPLLKPGHSIKFAFMPDGEDPDTLIRKGGAQALKRVLDASMSLFDFIWATHMEGRQLENPETRAVVIKNLEEQIKAIADPNVQTHYRSLMRRRISDTFFGGYKGGRKNKGGAAGGLKVRKPSFRAADLRTPILLATIINHPHVFEGCEELVGRFPIESPVYDRVRQSVVNILMERPDLDSAALVTHLKEEGFEKEIDDIRSESVYVHASFSGPGANPDDVERRLKAWLKEADKRNWQEIHFGWKKAFHSSSEEEENKLRQMTQEKWSET